MEPTRRALLRPLDEYEPPARPVDINELLTELAPVEHAALSDDSEDQAATLTAEQTAISQAAGIPNTSSGDT